MAGDESTEMEILLVNTWWPEKDPVMNIKSFKQIIMTKCGSVYIIMA